MDVRRNRSKVTTKDRKLAHQEQSRNQYREQQLHNSPKQQQKQQQQENDYPPQDDETSHSNPLEEGQNYARSHLLPSYSHSIAPPQTKRIPYQKIASVKVENISKPKQTGEE